MQLSKALQVHLDYGGILNKIHIDEFGYFNLNDMVDFFPHRNLKNWLETLSTKEYVKVIERMLNPHLDDDLNSGDHRHLKFVAAVRAKRGRYGGGTYAHKYVAMKFAMWLSPEFELEVIQAYENGVERKETWDIQRLMTANGYKFLVESVTEKLVPEFERNEKNSYYAYTEEADLLNLIVFGMRASEAGKNQRDDATETQLYLVEYLQRIDTGLIEAGLNYDQRFEKLTELYERKRIQLIDNPHDGTRKLLK